MPDKKITDLVDGDPLQPTDEFVVARAGDNFKIDGAAVVAAVTKHDVTLAGNTAGALALVSSGTLSLAGGNNITLSQAGNAVTISGAAQSVQTQNVVDVTLSGNTAGALALISSGTMTLAGGNNITVSQNGNAVTISGANVGGAQTGISGLANSEATYTSGTVELVGTGAITIASDAGQQFVFSVDPQSVQPETQTFIGGISASDTLYTSGTVRLTGVGGGITVGTNTGQRIDLSVAAQSVQPETQTFIGGISASNTLYTSGSVRFSGSQAVTVRSGTGQLVIIDAPAQSVQPETQTFIGGIGNSQTTYTSGTVNLSVVGGALTIRSTTGNAFQFSASQSVQPETQTAISGIANSQTTYTSGTVSLSELGAITIRSTTGNQFQLSVNSQTVQTQGILSAGVSTGGNTAGNTTVNTGSRFVIVASGNATASQATGAGASTVTISVGTQTVQTQGVLSAGVSTGGNTAGNTTVNTGSRFVLVGTNMVSLSQGTAAGATTISLDATNQNLSVGASNVGNTSGNTTVNTGSRLVIAGGNNITISQGTAAGATTLTISGPNVGGAQTGISGIANSQTTYTSGTVSWSELGAVTIRSTTGQQFQISVNSQTVQTQGILNVALSNVGNTAGDTGINSGTRYVLAGGNNVTLSGSTAANATTVTISAAAQSVQTQDVLSVGVSTGGNTAGNTTVNTGSRMVYVGSNMISLSQATAAGASTITFNATQSVQTNDIPRLGVSTGGNTAGDTTVNSGTRFVLVGSNMISLSQATAASATTVSINATNQNLSVGASNVGNTSGNTTVNTGSRLVFAGGNNITISQGTAAGATTLTISAPNLGAGAMSAGVSNLGNSAGATGITGTQLVLVGSDNITLSQTTGANGGTVSIIGGGGGGFSAGVSTGGNTAGDTGVTGTRMVFVGTGPISLSQATAAAGGTISVNAPATSSLSATGNIQISTNGSTISVGDGGGALDFWDNLVPGASTTFVPPNATLQVYPLNPANAGFPGYMSVNSIFFDLSGTQSTAAAWTRSISIGFYTRVNSTQLSLSASASTSFGSNAGNMNFADSFGGRRWVSFHSSQFDNAPNFGDRSDYFIAYWDRSSGGSQTFTWAGQLLPYYTGIRSGIMGAVSATNTTLGQYPFLGNYSVSFSTAMPAALAASDINKSNASAVSLPRVIFNNVASNIL